VEYVNSIIEDAKWLGANWEDRLFYASDYFGKLYEYAIHLIEKGKAYVCDLNAQQIREYRGTLTEPGKESPYRDRSVDENLELFEKMKNGEFEEGSRTLRAKIDMSSGNLNMRDPVLYRIIKAAHHRTGDEWCIYPSYDFTHGQSDALEGITHSICTLEFEDHRPLYNWFLENLPVPHKPRQIEFARLNLNFTVLSKRKLIRLVEEGHVNGWDDPRMPTISGLRRRGYTPESIWDFMDRIGVAKKESTVDIALLEHCIREDLNKRASRVMGVLNPVKMIIDNYPEDKVEEFDAQANPEDKSAGTRKVPFSRELYIEREDFMENPPKKYFRLSPGKEVRLKHAYYVKCVDVVKDEDGEVTEIHCTYDPETRGGWLPGGRKVKGTLHWVSVPHALDAEVRIYNNLFTEEYPTDVEDGEDFTDNINPNSLEILKGCKVEPSLNDAEVGYRCQFLRKGYFCIDPDTDDENLVFNQIVSLRDTWAKIRKQQKKKKKK
jgi:glutaminyl-tRNA synthetase